MKKYNEEKKVYEPYSVPEDWHCPISTWNMHEIINCVSCGTKIEYGDGYTSMQIHNDYGIGYSVCPRCHEREWQERKAAKEDAER